MERHIDPKLNAIGQAIVKSENGGVLSFSRKGRSLQPIVFVRELNVKLSLVSNVSIIGVERELTVSVRRKEDEGKKYPKAGVDEAVSASAGLGTRQSFIREKIRVGVMSP